MQLFCFGFCLLYLCACRLHDLRQIAAQFGQLAFVGFDRLGRDALRQWLLFHLLKSKGKRLQLCFNLCLALVDVTAQRVNRFGHGNECGAVIFRCGLGFDLFNLRLLLRQLLRQTVLRRNDGRQRI